MIALRQSHAVLSSHKRICSVSVATKKGVRILRKAREPRCADKAASRGYSEFRLLASFKLTNRLRRTFRETLAARSASMGASYRMRTIAPCGSTWRIGTLPCPRHRTRACPRCWLRRSGRLHRRSAPLCRWISRGTGHRLAQ